MNDQPPTGAPRDAAIGSDFVIVRGKAVQALGDYNTAGVFQRIVWRCERDGAWRVTIADLADEVWLSEKQVKRAIATLREAGWVDAHQDHPLDRTLTYSVVFEEVTAEVTPKSPTGTLEGPTGTLQKPQRAVPPLETETTTRDTHASVDASEIQRVISHHGDLVSNWAEPPRVTAATERVAERLIRTHGLDTVLSLVTWAQNHDFWRTRTATLSQVAKHAAKMRDQRRGGVHQPEVDDEHRSRVAVAF